MDNQIILACDDNGKFLEYIPKEVGHTGSGKRHLAITVLVYNNKGKVLLQRRKHKIFDDIWDLTASTHPLHSKSGTDESLEEATLRALKYEYDIDSIILKYIGSFNYFARTGNLCENEHDALFTGEYNGEVKLNPEAGYSFKWVDRNEFFKDISENPEKYSPWAIEGVKLLKKKLTF